MLTRSFRTLIIAICLPAFIATITAVERPTPGQCDKVTDAQIVAEIYGKIKADKTLAPQVTHINVVSLYAAVKFQGWADSHKDYDKIVGFGFDTACVRLVNANGLQDTAPSENNPSRAAGGCSSGTKQCGDVCIPEGDMCNITVEGAFQRILFKVGPDGVLALSFGGAACSAGVGNN